MSDASATPAPGPRYRLETFGTLALLGHDGDTVLGGHGHHRRRLALLAVLAAAGERGRSRDQLLALFWPEATQARARHSLDQLLYALRSTLDDSVFASRDPVRLDSTVLASDVHAFDAALERGDLHAAVELHRGPFLDGFHLGDALEFERWLDAERSRTEQRYTGALVRLAERAEAARDHTSAVGWRRRLAEADPLSAKSAAGLIRALKHAGDHAAALQHAERYEALVAEELGTSVGPEVASLVAEVRAEAAAHPLSAARPPTRMEVDRDAAIRLARGSIDARAAVSGEAADAPAPPRRSRRMTWIGLVALVAIVGVASAIGVRVARRPSAAAAAEQPAVAVLPFAVTGGTREDSMLADGIGQELTSSLARIERLRVVDRGSVLSLGRTDGDARRAAARLSTTHIVDGSIRWGGPRVRLQVRLVDASGATRWSETYERERAELVLVQADIAAAVARELGLAIAPVAMRAIRQPLTRNIAAYELFLRGRDPVHFRTVGDSSATHALALLQQAVALDPSFAAAYANMPYMYLQLLSRAPNLQRAREHWRMADSMARHALALDPLLPESHMAMAVPNVIGLGDAATAEREFRRAIALGGAPRVHELLANVLSWSGRWEEALAEAHRGVSEDPLSATANAQLGLHLCLNRQYDEGMAVLTRVASVQPPLLRVPGHRAVCHAMQGRWREAVDQMRDTRAGGERSALRAYLHGRAGDSADARALRDRMMASWRQRQMGAFGIAMAHAGLGELDEAFDWLNRAVDDYSLEGIVMYPFLDRLHADPRFELYRARLGLQKR